MQDRIPVLLCSLKSWPGKMKPAHSSEFVAAYTCRSQILTCCRNPKINPKAEESFRLPKTWSLRTTVIA